MTARRALWLVGRDIDRSLSPAMHNAALAVLGHELRYELHPADVDLVDEALTRAERECLGINVTAPFKTPACRLTISTALWPAPTGV
jgi:shikimate 5-dehydrogenase